jgi:hypothetical protein
VNIVDGLDSPKVVDSRVNTDLVETDQSGVLELLLQSLHLGVDVAGGDNVSLLLESDLHDSSVVGVGNERDYDIVTLDGLSESIGGGNINRHGGSVWELGSESLGSSKGPAGDGELVVVSSDVLGSGRSNETRAEEKDLLGGGLRGGVVSELGEDIYIVI